MIAMYADCDLPPVSALQMVPASAGMNGVIPLKRCLSGSGCFKGPGQEEDENF